MKVKITCRRVNSKISLALTLNNEIPGQNDIFHAPLSLSNNFQGVNFTMSKDEQAPEKEPKDRLSSYPSCCWYPSLLERLKDVVQLLQFGQFLKQVKDVVKLFSVFGCCNMVRIITNFYEVENPLSEICSHYSQT